MIFSTSRENTTKIQQLPPRFLPIISDKIERKKTHTHTHIDKLIHKKKCN